MRLRNRGLRNRGNHFFHREQIPQILQRQVRRTDVLRDLRAGDNLAGDGSTRRWQRISVLTPATKRTSDHLARQTTDKDRLRHVVHNPTVRVVHRQGGSVAEDLFGAFLRGFGKSAFDRSTHRVLNGNRRGLRDHAFCQPGTDAADLGLAHADLASQPKHALRASADNAAGHACGVLHVELPPLQVRRQRRVTLRQRLGDAGVDDLLGVVGEFLACAQPVHRATNEWCGGAGKAGGEQRPHGTDATGHLTRQTLADTRKRRERLRGRSHHLSAKATCWRRLDLALDLLARALCAADVFAHDLRCNLPTLSWDRSRGEEFTEAAKGLPCLPHGGLGGSENRGADAFRKRDSTLCVPQRLIPLRLRRKLRLPACNQTLAQFPPALRHEGVNGGFVHVVRELNRIEFRTDLPHDAHGGVMPWEPRGVSG